jgi:hypothetical protein
VKVGTALASGPYRRRRIKEDEELISLHVLERTNTRT